jgi:hypothetical protein
MLRSKRGGWQEAGESIRSRGVAASLWNGGSKHFSLYDRKGGRNKDKRPGMARLLVAEEL